MGTQTQNPGQQSKQSPRKKPGAQRPTDDRPGKDREEGQDIPKTGRDDELPGEGAGDDQVDRSRSADNP